MMNLWQVNIGVLWIISSEKCLQNSQENIYRSPIFSKGVFPVNFIKHLLSSTSQSLLLEQFCLFRLFEEPFYLFLSCARQRVVSVLPEVHMMFKCKSSNKHYGIRQVLATSKGIVKTSTEVVTKMCVLEIPNIPRKIQMLKFRSSRQMSQMSQKFGKFLNFSF